MLREKRDPGLMEHEEGSIAPLLECALGESFGRVLRKSADFFLFFFAVANGDRVWRS
jgi:hypothetical protein